MEVDESSKWLPSTEDMRNAIIVERLAQAHPALQVVAGADVVAGKEVDPAHSTEQGVFSRPSPHAAQFHQPGHRLVVLQIRQRFQIQPPCGDFTA